MKRHAQSTAEGILFTDQYQLTMAQLYFRNGMHEKGAQFEHFFRGYPNYGTHQAGFCVNAGLEWLLEWIGDARFRDEDIAFLRSQTGRTGERILKDDFLEWLRAHGSFEGISMRAIPEGRVVHPNVPLTVISGPLAMAQILETPLLNMLNFQTLIATKAARIREAARGRTLLEFGMRRAHERGANAGARAALIGGADGSSNVGISHLLGLTPRGTHAHSMVQAFMSLGGDELDAFRAYAELYPDDCLLLVDTVDTLGSGVPHAIRVFEELRRKGHKPVGIRLDSGDLSYLAIQAAGMLDAAGFPETVIVLSNELDELIIWQIIRQIEQEAPRSGIDPGHLIGRLVFGVGTRLITSEGCASLSGVYKLVAVRADGQWVPAIKISEVPEKSLNPGEKQAWRAYDERGRATCDFLSMAGENPMDSEEILLRHPTDHAKFRRLITKDTSGIERLHVEILKEGRRLYEPPPLAELRKTRQGDVERLDPGVTRLINPHIYHVSLTERLWNRKQELILATRRRQTPGR